MRKALITAVALGAALTLPAAAFADQNNYRGQYRCKSDKDNQVVGALVGGILGGLLGNEVAGRGNRTEGAVAGVVLGGVAGAAIADGKDCKNKRYGKRKHRNRYNNTGYNNGYNTYGNNRGYRNGYGNRNGYGYNTNTRYGNGDPYANERRQYRRHERRERRRARDLGERRGFWDERLEGGFKREAAYNSGYNTRPYRAQKCRYRTVTTKDGYGNRRTRQVKECGNANRNRARH
jgi:Glycine zipper 2TM domain